MKIFDWMQSKLNVTHGSKKPNSKSIYKNTVLGTGIEEFNDWPNGLLAIGTFGINNADGDLERSKSNFQGKTESSLEEHLEGLTSAGELQELKSLILLHQHIDEQSVSAPESEQIKDPDDNLPLEKFSNRQSSMEAHETTANNDNSDKFTSRNGGHKHSNNVVPSKGRDICLDNTKNAIGKKYSLSFLLKKMFVCRSGFSPAPSLRDPISESRLEKILRAILKKKVCPQSSSPSLAAKKYLDNRNKHKSTNEDEIFEKTDDGSKWVKTDSEYIVLEI